MSSNQKRREDKNNHHYRTHGTVSGRSHRSDVDAMSNPSENRRSKSPEPHHSHRRPKSPDRHRSKSSDHEHHHNHSHSHSMASSSSHRPRNDRQHQHDIRVLRCFCNCSQLTVEEIENVAVMNVSGLVNNSLGNRLFKTFVKIGHRTDKSNALTSIECYELCNTIIENIERYKLYIDDLMELCPDYSWEEKLNDAFDATESEAIDRLQLVLNELKFECLRTIECHNDYDRFRRELLRKIGK